MSRHLLDTTVLIAHLRGDERARRYLLDLLRDEHDLCVSAVSVAELERGLRPGERKLASRLIDRLWFLVTTREAAARAGRYQSAFGRRGRTIALGDALIAGTARAHGAIVVTDNTKGFPMSDLRTIRPPSA